MFRRQLWSENRLSLDLNPVASISFGRPRTKRSVYQYRVRDVDELRERCAGECDERDRRTVDTAVRPQWRTGRLTD